MGKKSLKKRFIGNKRADMEKKPSQNLKFIHTTRNIAWKIIFTAIIIIIAGYILLSKVDPLGKNLYAVAAPVFLIGGHIMVAFGLAYNPKTSANSK